MWIHVAMCFGAASSVWNINRTADTLQALTRCCCGLSPATYFLDDVNGSTSSWRMAL